MGADSKYEFATISSRFASKKYGEAYSEYLIEKLMTFKYIN